MAFIDYALFAGYPLGNALSGLLFRKVGYYTIFIAAGVLSILNLIFVFCFVKETKGPRTTHPVCQTVQDIQNDLERDRVSGIHKYGLIEQS